MHTATNSNPSLIEHISFSDVAELQKAVSRTRVYQQIASALIKGVYTKQALTELNDRLVALAEQAYAIRQMDLVAQAGQILLNLGLRQYEEIGRYYKALSIKREGRFEEARALLLGVSECAPLKYRVKAMVSLGATFFDSGDVGSALKIYVEGGRAATLNKLDDPLTALQMRRMIAVVKSVDGDHGGALADLESLLPLARIASSAHPSYYYDHLNSVAVELMEVCRLEEAEQASHTALASPCANAYPEWRETGYDIAAMSRRRASHSVVAVNQTAFDADNIVRLPASEHVEPSTPASSSSLQRPARILNYSGWIKKMVKEPDSNQSDEESPEKMTKGQLVLRLIELVSLEDMTEGKLRKMLESIETIASEPAEKP